MVNPHHRPKIREGDEEIPGADSLARLARVRELGFSERPCLNKEGGGVVNSVIQFQLWVSTSTYTPMHAPLHTCAPPHVSTIYTCRQIRRNQSANIKIQLIFKLLSA